MSSKNPIKRVGMLVVFVLCALITAFNSILGAKAGDILSSIVSVVSALAFIGFCLLAALRNDNKDTLVALALTAYAGINSAWIFVKACEALAHGYFPFETLLWLGFYVILLYYGIKDFLPAALKANLDHPITKLIAVALVWIVPIMIYFILPLFTAQGGIAGRVGGQILITLLEWLLQSIAFTWFIKE